MNSTRFKLLFIPAEKLPELLGLTRYDTALVNPPEGVEVVRARYDWATDQFQILLRHPDFDPVPAEQVPPEIWAVVKTTLKPQKIIQKNP